MAYVLNLVPPQGEAAERPAATDVLDRLGRDLGEAGEITEGEPGSLWWTHGGTKIAVRVAADRGGTLREVDVVVPYGALLEEAEAAIRHLTEVAGDGPLQLFDPQLGRSVGGGDLAAISACYAQASAYHVEYSGTAEDTRQGVATAAAYEQPTFFTPRTKVFLVALGILAALYFVFRVTVLDPITDALAPAPTLERPEGGPPPGWLDRHPPAR